MALSNYRHISCVVILSLWLEGGEYARKVHTKQVRQSEYTQKTHVSTSIYSKGCLDFYTPLSFHVSRRQLC